MHRWFRFLASLVFVVPTVAFAQEMDFGGGEEGGEPPPEEIDAPPPEEPLESATPEEFNDVEPVASDAVEEERAPIYVFAVTPDESLGLITRELDAALRDTLLGLRQYTMEDAEALLNGRGFGANAAIQQGQELFDAGRAAYDNLELDEAVELFNQALQVYEEQIGHVTDLNNVSDCFLYLGAAEVLRGRARQSRTPFLRLLIIDPERRPDPDLFPPPVTEAFDYVTSQLGRVRNGGLIVNSSPAGADVFIDGVYQGPTPQEVSSIKAGRHYVRVRQQGFTETGQVVDITPRRTIEVEANLEPTEDGPMVAELLQQLAIQIAEASDEASETVQRLGEVLNLEVLFTAVVVPEVEAESESEAEGEAEGEVDAEAENGNVSVLLNGWDVMRGESIAQVNSGPFAADAVVLIGDIQSPFEELVSSTWTTMNTAQAPIEPVVEPQPDIEPEPERRRRPFWQRWWFWTAVGAVVLGAGLGIGFGAAAAGNDDAPVNGEVIIDL